MLTKGSRFEKALVIQVRKEKKIVVISVCVLGRYSCRYKKEIIQKIIVTICYKIFPPKKFNYLHRKGLFRVFLKLSKINIIAIK